MRSCPFPFTTITIYYCLTSLVFSAFGSDWQCNFGIQFFSSSDFFIIVDVCLFPVLLLFHTGLLTVCEQNQSWSRSQAVSKPVWHIPSLCVQWKTPDDGQRNCPKHVEFYSKNKCEKSVHLVGFIIRIHTEHSTLKISHEVVKNLLSYQTYPTSNDLRFAVGSAFPFPLTKNQLRSFL